MKYHNLRTVVGFEVHRTITKKRFWIATMIVPIALAIVFALVYLSNTATSTSIAAQRTATFTFAYTDASGLVSGPVVSGFGGVEIGSDRLGIARVRSGQLDAFFAFPANPMKQAVRVYGRDVGVFNNGKYSTVATEILRLSADAKIGSRELATLARSSVNVETTTYKDGVKTPGLRGVIPPLIYLVIFYIVLILLGNQMLNSTLEEKENRVTEMILTTVDPTTLITGKIIALFTAGLVQIAVFASPVLVGYVFFRSKLNLPNLNLSSLVFSTERMTVGALLLLGGFTLFTGTLVALGAIMPTAKEAGGFFGVMMALIFTPFYAASLIVSHPDALIVRVFTYFPYTAPVTGMLRNGFGSLSAANAAGLIVEVFLCGFIVLRLAVQLFRYGSIEYTKKVSIRTALGLHRWRGPR